MALATPGKRKSTRQVMKRLALLGSLKGCLQRERDTARLSFPAGLDGL
jgi:hypothetical protein|tara:strand:- start:466 stop:609 length:144 start_codon:yes stop_codon:yes gene_type:complete